MTLALIRHGQTDWNRDDRLQGSSDIPLNDAGRAQAHAAAGALAAVGTWHAIVSSPLSRARETAEIIARDLGLELGPSYPDLVERDYGALEGTSSSAAVAAHPHRDYPGAETLDEVATRGRRALDEIADAYGEQQVVIVAHGTLIRYTLASLAGHPIAGILNGTVSTAERIDGRWDVLTVNGEPCEAADDEGRHWPGMAG
ncbi:histidine phosphatase family protein [Pseudolysinimonas sp.]|uniref:histidine phosphatase family protein n=1 Tax=Pseudolysinimonas sp. TaxID=2680009 RepID=UPI003F7FF0AD